jgi:predicted transcriptional regulator
MKYDKIKKDFVKPVKYSRKPDYTVCLNCGKKEKEPKWIKTHFCSLPCFGEYKKSEIDMSL